MKPTRNRLHLMGALTIVVMAGMMPQAWGGGARIPDQSTRAMGMMDAFVAGADDASAVAYNPAGLTRLQVPEAIANLYFAHADVFYTNGDDNQSSAGRYFTIPNLYLGAPLDKGRENFLGLGVYTPFGLGARWGDNPVAGWANAKAPGQTVFQETELQLVDVNPTFARKITDQLSLGAGLDYYISRVRQRSWTNYGFGVGQNLLDVTGDGWGYNFGLTYDFTPQLALGVIYRSKVKVDYDGDMDFENMPPGITSSEATTKITYPQSVAAGLCWKPVERFRLEFTAEWMDWSEWDQREVNVNGHPLLGPGPQTITIPLDWHDSWILCLGGEYKLTDQWRLRAGYGYNETPVSKKLGDVDLPTGDTHALSLGAGYQMTAAVALDAALIVVYSKKRELDASSAPPGSDFWAISAYLSAGITYCF